jgi:hypothetical protein
VLGGFVLLALVVVLVAVARRPTRTEGAVATLPVTTAASADATPSLAEPPSDAHDEAADRRAAATREAAPRVDARPPTTRFFGRLLADSGPVTGQHIRRGVVTDDAGLFSLVRSGDVEVDVEGYATVHAQLTDEHTTPERALEIRLARLATIRGACVDPNGVRLRSGVTVVAVPLSDATGATPAGGVSIEMFGSTVAPLHAGEFEIVGVHPGVPVKLGATRERLSLASMLLEPLGAGEDRFVEIDIPSLACISGTLLDDGGAPMARQRLHLDRADGLPLGVQVFDAKSAARVFDDHWTGELGQFWMCGIPAGRWALVAATLDGTFLGHVFDIDGSDLEVEITLPEPVLLTGRVVESTGTSAARFFRELEVESEPFGDGRARRHEPVGTDEHDFVLRLPPALHRLRAHGVGSTSDWVEVMPPGRVVLTMPPKRRLSGRLVGPEPFRFDCVRFTFRPGKAMFAAPESFERGEFSVDGFPETAFTLQITDAGTRRVASVEIGPGSGETRVGTIAMTEGCQVTLWSLAATSIAYAADVDGVWLDVIESRGTLLLPRGILRLVPIEVSPSVELTDAVERARSLPTDLVFDLHGRAELWIDLDDPTASDG